MIVSKKEIEFTQSELGKWCRQTLMDVELDQAYYSTSSFTSDVENYPDNRMPFVTTHMNYLAKHPEINPHHYISNLRLRSKKSQR